MDGAEGTYVEPTLSFYHFVNPLAGPAVSWATTLDAGFQSGQRNADAGIPGASGTGLTHIALSSGLRVDVALWSGLGLVLAGGPIIQYSRDPATRARNDGSRSARFRLWLPLRAGLTVPFRRGE